MYSRIPADNSFQYLATTTSTSYLDNSVNSCNLTVGPAPSSQEISYKVRGVDSNGTKGHFSNVVNYDFGNGGCPGASY